MSSKIDRKDLARKRVNLYVEAFGLGRIHYPYMMYKWEQVAPDRDVPDEKGVGPSMKTTTHAAGIFIDEYGTAMADVHYPYWVMQGMRFVLRHEDWAEDTSGSYAAWRALINQQIINRYTILPDEPLYEELFRSGRIGDLIIALSMYAIGKHAFLSLNSAFSAVTSAGTPIIPFREGTPNFGQGILCSKNGLRYAMKLLEDVEAESRLSQRSVSGLVFKPLLMAYEMGLRRIAIKDGYYGVGGITQEDIYYLSIGSDFDVEPRTTEDWLNGNVHLTVLARYLGHLIDNLEPIWSLVEPLLKTFCAPMDAPDSDNYLKWLMNPMIVTRYIDEDIWYELTRIFAIRGEHAMVRYPFGFRLEPDPGMYVNNMRFFWLGHPFRMPWYPLAHLYPTANLPEGDRFTVWEPQFFESVLGQNIYGDVPPGNTEQMNLYALVYPHNPQNGTVSERPNFTFERLLDVFPEEDYTGLAVGHCFPKVIRAVVFADDHSMMDCVVAQPMAYGDLIYERLAFLFDNFQYATWTYGLADGTIWYETFFDWVNKQFTDQTVLPRIWNELSPMGPGRTRKAKGLTPVGEFVSGDDKADAIDSTGKPWLAKKGETIDALADRAAGNTKTDTEELPRSNKAGQPKKKIDHRQDRSSDGKWAKDTDGKTVIRDGKSSYKARKSDKGKNKA